MGIKKKLGLGMASAALGISLIGGGTFAYFSDTAEVSNTFAAGTLDLSVDPETIINVNDIKPGDWMKRNFKLINSGSLDISSVDLITSYTVTEADGSPANNGDEDFGKHIKVQFLKNKDKVTEVIDEKTLYELKNMTPDAVENLRWRDWIGEKDGLKAGTSDNLRVKFIFVDNDEDQNVFQGDKLELKWKFVAHQTDGEEK
ncbi:CalY family protein [Cytobacillus sp. IB215316]|uniref:CalY family protein n=1 Tax=Cytobacillus sp. IB215316 TaxID=3097354 RepID=UPI002A0EEB6D|nr:CalY family protein [Cytobacillus sp. IB215316]MDX8362374.1 CalY family protein [Cytobacillus sp. IB215316]